MNSRHLFILTSLLLLVSCNEKEPEDVYYPLDRTNWFRYEEGDTLLFKNNPTAIDTYILNNIETFYAKLSTYSYYELLQVDYEGIPQCNNCPIWQFIRGPNAVDYSGNFPIAYSHYEDSTIEYRLGDTTLLNIYVVEDIPTEDTIYYKVKALYYSNDYGYIRYDMYDDRVYELQLE